MQLNAHLNFDGRCEAALKFYAQCLGGKINTLLTWGGSPMAASAPAGWENKIIHATLSFDGQILSGADAPPNHQEKLQGFALTLGVKDPEEAQRVFQALSPGGTVVMPLQPTFWSKSFGMIRDQFGVSWMINCQQAP